ncbi:hypothetical protein PG993_002255 [Apiospora rasikravindrae]|uniref:Uncharacterized protein n=1 Tax=Apiospora rasikravindrae TaxID=990691 RepID=A0ABR1TYD2_9PEZI
MESTKKAANVGDCIASGLSVVRHKGPRDMFTSEIALPQTSPDAVARMRWSHCTGRGTCDERKLQLKVASAIHSAILTLARTPSPCKGATNYPRLGSTRLLLFPCFGEGQFAVGSPPGFFDMAGQSFSWKGVVMSHSAVSLCVPACLEEMETA